jgi:hypothetical protein
MTVEENSVSLNHRGTDMLNPINISKKLFIIFISTIYLFLFTGCASVTSGKHQTITVNTTCEGEPLTEASCTLLNDKGSWLVKTPGSVVIQKAYGDLAIDCKKGESKSSEKFQSKSNTGVWGNLLVGGVIGYAVDASSGSGFDYPSNMVVKMNAPCQIKSEKISAASEK